MRISFRHVLIVFVLLCLITVHLVNAQTMSSGSYKIQFDSVNTGGELSTSSNYSLEDTAGEIATGNSSSTNYAMKGGYQQMNESYISITAELDSNLSSLSGIVGGETGATTTWTVVTDNTAGYQVFVRASTEPALKSGSNSFTDYIPGGPDPDFTFSVPSTQAVFGFSPEGSDIIQRYKDNGSACNAGSSDTASRCWDGFSTTTKLVAERYSANHPSGSLLTLRYRAGIGSSILQPPGNYSAEITVTALTL